MGKPELGTKIACAGCHERFYDLNRSPAVCPKCGVEQPPPRPRTLRPPRSPFGTGMQSRRPPATATVDDEAEPVSTAETEDEAEDDVPEADDDADDDIEIDPGLTKTAD